MENPGYYAIIIASVRYDKRLKPNAKLLYGEISALTGREGYCWADNKYFAQLYMVSTGTISRWISQLEEYGYLIIQYFPEQGNKRRIYINEAVGIVKNDKRVLPKKTIAVAKLDNRVLSKRARPIVKNDKSIKESITNNITTNSTESKNKNKALTFIQNNFPEEWNEFMETYRNDIPNAEFEEFTKIFNCKVVEESIEFRREILVARLTRFAIHYIKNIKKNENKNSIFYRYESKPAYMQKPLS